MHQKLIITHSIDCYSRYEIIFKYEKYTYKNHRNGNFDVV